MGQKAALLAPPRCSLRPTPSIVSPILYYITWARLGIGGPTRRSRCDPVHRSELDRLAAIEPPLNAETCG
jgi:hypothetical protein